VLVGTGRPEGCFQGHSPRPRGAGREGPALKEYATHWLTDPEYEVLRYRMEAAPGAAEEVLVEAKPKGMFELGVGAVGAKAKFSEPPNCQAHLLFVNRENFIWGAANIKRS
jgi:hypothetical protein